MAVKMPIFNAVSTLRYKGIFDIDGLFKLMRAWFDEREYDFFEDRYKHKNQTLGYEIEIDYSGTREINEFVQNKISVYIHIWDYNELEVIQDGKKKIVGQGRMLINFKAALICDYEDRWQSSKFKRSLRDFYITYILRHEISDIWGDKLFYNCNKLQQSTKRFLGMQSESDVYDDMW